MKEIPVFGKRLRWGTAVISALLLAGGGLASLQSTAQASSPDGQEAPGDVQSHDGLGDSFSGYQGYVGDDPQGVAMVHEPAHKAGGLGKIASSEGHSPDVPGVVVPEPRPASPDLMIPSAPSEAQVAAVRKVIAHHGAARVIVMTNAEVGVEANLSASAVRAQRQGIATSLNDLQTTVAGTGSRRLLAYKVVPSAVYNVTRAGLNALLRDSNVVSVVLDGQVQGELDSSTQVIQSNALNTAGILGNNFEGSTTGAYQVAIIDSGVDNGHNAFSGRIVSQACFVTDFSCPGGTNLSLAQALPTSARTRPIATTAPTWAVSLLAASLPADTRAWRVVRSRRHQGRSGQPSQSQMDGHVLVDRQRPTACAQPQELQQPQYRIGQSQHRGWAVQCWRPSVQRSRSDYELLVRPAPGSRRSGSCGCW